MKQCFSITTSLFFAAAITLPPVVAAEEFGNHTGEAKQLAYRIEYLSPLGVTRVDGDGITYMPFGGLPHTDPAVLPEKYFGDNYALYFSGRTMRFRVSIENTSHRTFKNLRIVAMQEYLNIEGLTGDPIGANNANEWFVSELRGGEEIMLEGSFFIPRDATSGLDQTHLQIWHWEGSADQEVSSRESGRIILDDPQAGIWCPV